MAGDITFSGVAQNTTVTVAPEQQCHYIRDDELDRLSEMKQEPVMEICLASIGIFFGSLVPTIDAMSRFNAATNPMSLIELITALLTFSAFAVMLVTGFLWRIRIQSQKSLANEIRSRPKMPVRLVHDAG